MSNSGPDQRKRRQEHHVRVILDHRECLVLQLFEPQPALIERCPAAIALEEIGEAAESDDVHAEAGLLGERGVAQERLVRAQLQAERVSAAARRAGTRQVRPIEDAIVTTVTRAVRFATRKAHLFADA
jgi:hypothetical protein